ncbi:MAG: ribonuclease HII [Candidatus Aenigmarchaeota archaeon]|nr:ribonuclease HII [Candidatus Aenigmarchaeota archaeon]
MGCVIGPLVICGYLIEEEKVEKLKHWNVRDSKLVSPKRRGFLYGKLKELADDMIILKISAMDIDKNRTISNLNKLWHKRVAEIINSLRPGHVFIDALEANTGKCAEKLRKNLNEELKAVAMTCENAADRKYPVVGAASIIAKVVRDAEIRRLHEEHGNFGSGYTSDPRTVTFLKNWIEKNKHFPSFVRHSWITARELKKNKIQTRLKDFSNGE